MVRHNVFFWLEESLSEAEKSAFEDGLKAMFSIDAIANARYGKPAGTAERPVTQNSYDYSLFLEFDDVEKHNAYQVHPGHTEFVEKFSKWFKEVRVYDTELSN